jgi:hypothetical protein
MPNKTSAKQEKYRKWPKNHVRNEFYLSPNKSTMVDWSFMTYLLFHRSGFWLYDIYFRQQNKKRLAK